ncbi:hypothetical protein Ga0100231_023190 [Opitutaceae bacterium TAV4]|uniref:tetratricopeptide repeat protein n=1 Tax=Geminisphaera colitermitum TaxID=1148786 RepID=UPI000158CF8A|nr:tetratricopeptide repeat protein [Geminisphaera colitermitum]RRJ96698.1 hypothetical protein Ga0100231_023190 [Opitutaceae bacterium TAV4]RRK02550.1 hypothetical protein Ga0100230_005380 [Opitutaceae bacterium TAV3]
MQEIPVQSLDPRLQKQVENAQIALQRGNFDYVVELCSQVLKNAPGCLPVRRLQRIALMRGLETKNKAVVKALGSMTQVGFLFASKKDPVKVLENAERMLIADPTNTGALKQMADAATAIGLHETAAFAWECIRDLQPKNHKTLVTLAEMFLAAKKPIEALKVADELLRHKPQDGEALALMRRASVAQTMDKGKWENKTSFREKLRDEKQAVSLEQASKVITSSEMTERLVEEAKARHAAEPENLNHLRAIIDGYRRLGDSASALEWVRKTVQIPAAAADASFEKLATELEIELLEKTVREAEQVVEATPDDEAAKSALETAKTTLSQFRLKEAQDYCEHYPNDYAARFNLANLYYEAGDYEDAIANYQQAQKNPKVRIHALAGMGKSLKARRMFDLAIAQFQIAKGELSIMDDLKKDVIYQLAECYESMGRTDDAITEFKLIYSEDIGFRDVADKINAYYSNR